MGPPLKPQYLSVRNWEKFQHYKQRRPPWVKFHVELLDDYELMHLSISSQLVYDRLLLLAARLDNAIPNDAKYVASLIHLPTKIVFAALTDLIDTGFLDVSRPHDASNPQANLYTRDRGRDREETEAQKLSEEAPVENLVERSLRIIG